MIAAAAHETVRTVDAGSYAVHIGRGLRRDFATHIVAATRAHRYAVVSDANVAPLFADALVAELEGHALASLHVIGAGEEHKTRDTWLRVTDELLALGCGRDTTVVALGGGVVGDLAGFVASTYMRGIPVVQIPTSLLAMIDASVGGKTGVDTAMGKNLVGTFHPPAAVLADVEMLSSLPIAHRRAGLAEAIKHGVIADRSYFTSIDRALSALIEGDPDVTLDVVARSVELKAEVVRSDMREGGRRKTLNFGHTLGHAIEQVSGYSLLHGECVAIGMVLEARLAERLGIAEGGTARAIEAVLARAALPIERPKALDVGAVLGATHRDKKSRAGVVEYALPTRIGAMDECGGAWSVAVGDEHVREVLR